MKNLSGIVIVGVIVALHLVLYPFLPAEVVTKWDTSGNPTFSMSRLAHTVAGIIMPVFVFGVMTAVSYAAKPPNRRQLGWIASAVVIFMAVTDMAISFHAMGYDVPIDRIVIPVLGLLLVVMGFIVPGMESDGNYQVQLQSPELQQRLQKQMGFIFIGSGAMLAVLALLVPGSVDFVLLPVLGLMIASVLGTVIYYFMKDANVK